MQPEMSYFYSLACVAALVFLAGVAGHCRFWLSSDSSSRNLSLPKAPLAFSRLNVKGLTTVAHSLCRLINVALLQRPLLHHKGWVSWAIHMALMWTIIWLFIVGSVGNMLAEVGLLAPVKDDPWFAFSNDLAGAVLVFAILAMIWRRFVRPRPPRASLTRLDDGLVASGLLLVSLSGFAVEATRYLTNHTPVSDRSFAFVGNYLALAVDSSTLPWDVVHLSAWWVHAIGALALIAYIPYSRLSHLFAAPVHSVLAEAHRHPVSSHRAFSSTSAFTPLQMVELDACTRCGECMRWCETFLVNRDLALAPPQKIALFRSLFRRNLFPASTIEGDIGDTGGEVARGVFDCTLCGRCAVVCPVQLNLRELYISMREALVARHLYPSDLDLAKLAVAGEHNIVNYPNDERAAWVDYLSDAPDDCYQRPTATVVYFVGCMSSFSPAIQSIPAAYAKVLTAAGVDFTIMGPDEWCCGFPLLAAGMSDAAEELRQHNVAMIRRRSARVVTFSCPSCYHTWRNHYAAELPGVELLHSSQLIERLLCESRLPLRAVDLSVTYHDPCDLGRNSGIYQPPRDVIRALPRVSLLEAVKNGSLSHCCGGGGDLEISDPVLSASVAAISIDAYRSSGAQSLVTACQQCKRVLSAAAERQQSALEVLDLTELVARALS